jgi:hypothetical protein
MSVQDAKELLQSKIRFLLDKKLPTKIWFAEREPDLPIPSDMLASPRIILPLSGEKPITFACNKEILSKDINKGEALFVPPLCHTKCQWHKAHSMLSLVMEKDYLRILYIDLPEGNPEILYPVADAYFHIYSVQDITRKVFDVLSEMNMQNNSVCSRKLYGI